MKQRDRDYLENETKKEYITRIAQEEPFLKIEEIAELASTTQRYVRTILSEANLSLMNLREEYARRMEKNSESKIMFSLKESLQQLGLHSSDNSTIFTYGLPQSKIIDESDKLKWNIYTTPLFGYIQHIYYYEKPFGLLTIVSPIELNSQQLGQKASLYHTLGFNSEETRLSSPVIEFGKLIDLLKMNLDQEEFSPEMMMIKLNMFIYNQGQILGKESFYFPSDYVKLTISGFFSSTLELISES